MKSKRQNGLDEAAYWVEYGIKYPNSLTPKSAYLSFFELHMLDVYAFIIVNVVATTYILKKIFKFICTKFKSTKKLRRKHKKE